MADTTQIFLLDTAYVRSLAKEVADTHIDYVSIIVAIISAIAILVANRMTLKRIKGDTFYQSRLSTFQQWEVDLREAAVNFVTVIHTGFYFWLSDTYTKNVAVFKAKALVESAKDLGHNIRVEDMNRFTDVFDSLNDKALLFMEKANHAAAKLKYMLNRSDTHYTEIIQTSQKLLDIHEAIKTFEAKDTKAHGQFVLAKQKEAMPLTDNLHVLIMNYITDKKTELQNMGGKRSEN